MAGELLPWTGKDNPNFDPRTLYVPNGLAWRPRQPVPGLSAVARSDGNGGTELEISGRCPGGCGHEIRKKVPAPDGMKLGR